MRLWPRRTIRSFGVANVVFGLVGLAAIVASVALRATRTVSRCEAPYVAQAYYVATAINLICVLALLYAGVCLWQVQRRGVIISNALFVFEIVYFVGSSWIGLALAMAGGKAATIGHSMSAVGGTGNMGTAPQIITGYPAIALIVLNIAYRAMNRPERSP